MANHIRMCGFMALRIKNTMKVFLFFILLSNVLLSQELSVGISSNPVTQGEKFRLEFRFRFRNFKTLRAGFQKIEKRSY